MHSKLYLKYIDSKGNFHFQSVADILDVGPLIESDGENEGDEMTLVDDNFYDEEGNLLYIQSDV